MTEKKSFRRRRATTGRNSKKVLIRESLRFIGLSIAFAILLVALLKFANLCVSETRIGLYSVDISKYEGIRDSALESANNQTYSSGARKAFVSDAEGADSEVARLSKSRENLKLANNNALAYAARNGFSFVLWSATLVASLAIIYVLVLVFPSWGTYRLYGRTVKRIYKLLKVYR